MSDFYGAIEDESWVQSIWIENCCTVAAACLVFYDHLATLGQEINLIWGRRLSSVTLLFHLNRWTTLIWVITALLMCNLSNPEYESSLAQRFTICASLGVFEHVLDLSLSGFWAAFSSIRMYVVSGSSWPLTFVTSLLSMVPVGTNAYSYFGTTTYAVGSIPGVGQWCINYSSLTEDTQTKFTIATRLCIIAADVLILVVTWCKTYATKREADRHGLTTPLATMLLCDGTLYFALLLCLNVLDIAGNATNVFINAGAFNTPLSSIIISHFLLDLRQLAYGPRDDGLDSRPSFVVSQDGSPNGAQTGSLRFASFVDNMGEDLDHGSGTADGNMVWDAAEADGDVEGGSPSHVQTEPIRNLTPSSEMSGSCPDAADIDCVEGIGENATKDKASPQLSFGMTPGSYSTPTVNTGEVQTGGCDGLSYLCSRKLGLDGV